MTDITELAQSLKAAAEKATPGPWVAFTHADSLTFSVHTPDDKRCGDIIKWAGFDGQRKAKANAEFIALANPANILALVESLEKAQRRNTEQDAELEREREKSRRVMSRIAVLEESHAQVIHSRDHYKRMSEEGLKQLAESRTVTVKLPEFKMLEDYLAEVAVEERKAILLVVRMEFHHALNAEGIKLEAE